MKKSLLALPFQLALSIKAVDRLIAKAALDPFTFCDRESILALGRLRARRDELVALATVCKRIRESFQGRPAPGTEVRICSRAPSR
jgi:hypothetical protein